MALVVGDTQSDSIQYLNFAKKLFIQYSIQYLFTQDSIQTIIQLKKFCWFNSKENSIHSQEFVDTGLMGKVPKNCPKRVQNRQK